MSDSVWPHRWQPTRLPCPWDSPGKNTGFSRQGVGCHFLLQCMKVKSESEVAQSCPTLSDPMDCSLPGSSVHGFSRQEYCPCYSPEHLGCWRLHRPWDVPGPSLLCCALQHEWFSPPADLAPGWAAGPARMPAALSPFPPAAGLALPSSLSLQRDWHRPALSKPCSMQRGGSGGFGVPRT